MVFEFVLGAVLVGTSITSALAALLILHLVLRRRAARSDTIVFDLSEDETVFLFDDETLIDATDSARALLDSLPPGGGPWARLSTWLGPRFPGFATAIGELARHGRIEMRTIPGTPPLLLRAEWRKGVARIVLHDPQAEGRLVAVDRLGQRAAEEELARLRGMMEQAPLPIWREATDGTVIWANPAYLTLASARDAEAGVLTWPLPQLFHDLPDPDAAQPQPSGAAPRAAADDRHRLRRSLHGGETTRWFACIVKPQDDGERICFALPADATVRAETSLNDFIQTLTRTFASLPVGLAVFDRQRRLQLFNPALIDLTALAPAFLSARPTLAEMFDALRARQMIPEPKDYRSWRDALTEVERAAEAGHFEETWSLASGQTYRVTGRPHPDGAVAFLIEDITAEISLTRRFRAELETGQAVFDSLSEAIAVFSPAGVLFMANSAYAQLWGVESETRINDAGVAEALDLWQSASHPSPHWAQLRTLIGAGGPRCDWSGAIQLRDGRHMECRLAPLAGGATLVGFRDARATGGASSITSTKDGEAPVTDTPHAASDPAQPSRARA